MGIENSLRLEYSDGRETPDTLDGINGELGHVGSKIWPLDLRQVPEHVQSLIKKKTLTDEESKEISDYFLMPRERFVELLKEAGREPKVPGGGALVTRCMPYDYTYPQLYIVLKGVDYSRFDRFHINVSDDGNSVDEVMWVLSGDGVVLHQIIPGGLRLSLFIDCPSDEDAWILTYEGDNPHIGSISHCSPGSKVLMQVVGPDTWVMRYEGDELFDAIVNSRKKG